MGELNYHNLTKFVEHLKCSTFVETGTGIGTGLKYAATYPFDTLYSIEFVKELSDKVTKELQHDKRITIINSDSLKGLESVLPSLKEAPTLFWLDAHFPGADFHFNDYHHLSDEPKYHMPLRDEIQLIKSLRNIEKDCFIIDDLRIYEEGPYELGAWDLYDKYGGGGIDFIIDVVKETHDVVKLYGQQGFLVITPKE